MSKENVEALKGDVVNRKCIGSIDFSKPKGQRKVECDATVYKDKKHPGFYICEEGHEWGYL